jgi:uncharacterized protein (TIGR00251 family)
MSAKTPAESAEIASEKDGALLLSIHVVPRASKAAVGPIVGGALRVAVTAPPVDGAANAAVIAALADAFNVRKRDITIVHGERGRKKTVRIAGATLLRLAELL